MKHFINKAEFFIHATFWLALILLNIWNNNPTFQSDNYLAILAKFLLRWTPFMALAYIHIVYLAGRLFQPKQYHRYLIALGGLWLVGSPIAIMAFNELEKLFDFVAEPNFISPFSLNTYIVSLFVLFVTVAIHFVFRLMQQQNEYSQLQNLHLNMELDSLKNQINPHFFFNTLHNLHALVLDRSEYASEVILTLSAMMRYSLYECEQTAVTLEREIQYLEHYLYLQKIRLHKQVDIQFQQLHTHENTLIPPLLLIVLVENAFKHGVDSLTKDSFVHISLQEQENRILFSIKNNYDQQDLSEKETGLGLKNVQKRLQLLFGKNYEFKILDELGIFEVLLNIPKQ